MIVFSQDVKDRFMKKVAVAEGGCWNWTAGISLWGYGKVRVHNHDWRAHRLAYEMFTGSTDGQWVLHKCDNRKCVNPEHLYLGNAKQNSKDRSERKRYRVMTPLAVVDGVREKYATGSYTQQELADLYGIKQSQVSRYVLMKQRQSY